MKSRRNPFTISFSLSTTLAVAIFQELNFLFPLFYVYWRFKAHRLVCLLQNLLNKFNIDVAVEYGGMVAVRGQSYAAKLEIFRSERHELCDVFFEIEPKLVRCYRCVLKVQAESYAALFNDLP